MDKDKAEVYGLMADIGCKVLITFVFCGVFIAVVTCLLRNPNLYFSIPAAILPYTVYQMSKHFFPVGAERKPKRAPRAKSSAKKANPSVKEAVEDAADV